MIQTARTHKIPGLINLYGIESPGLTSSLALAEEVARALTGEQRHIAVKHRSVAGRAIAHLQSGAQISILLFEDMFDLHTGRQQIIGNDAAVAAPPYGFGAHDRRASGLRNLL